MALGLLGFALGGCGGGSDQTFEGTIEARVFSSRINGTNYAINLYIPPTSAGPRTNLPVVYMLDGESWFETLVDIAESTHSRFIIVGINSSGRRNHDFVPVNSCTPDGGGNGAYFAFIREELVPYVESTVGGDPDQRVLFGHSHGGSFVLYAMFSEAQDRHTFSAYLASDSSLSCMPAAADAWNADYASAYSELPVRLHLSYATLGNYDANVAYAAAVAGQNYGHLVFIAQAYSGTHGGIVPQVLRDAIVFALPGAG